MSTEDHLAEIGRVVTERATAVKRQAALRRELERLAKTLLGIGGPLCAALSPESLRRAMSALNELIEDGGLERLKTVLSELESLSIKLADLERTLKEAGVA